MNERNDSAAQTEAEKSTPVSFADAARFLGVDTFTFYSIVQREEIPFIFATSGEFVISQDELNKLAGKESPC
jgi:hypothetical protein